MLPVSLQNAMLLPNTHANHFIPYPPQGKNTSQWQTHNSLICWSALPPPCCPCHPISYTHRMPNFEKRHAPQVAYKSWPKTIITRNSPNFRQSHLSEICPLWGLLFPRVQNKPTGYVLQTKRWSRAEAAPEEANIGFVAMPGVLKRG